jgi:imidazolonepropionase-like amidohydrolase
VRLTRTLSDVDAWVCMPAFSASHTLYAPCATSKPGKLGVVEEGALADLLLVDGNPLENIKLIEDPTRSSWSS